MTSRDLPVALRDDRITEGDVDTLLSVAKDKTAPAGRYTRPPRRVEDRTVATAKEPAKPVEEEIDPLPEAIRKVSEGMQRLLKAGFNQRAVVALLKDHTGLGKAVIEQVLLGLSGLADKYTTPVKK